MRFAIRLDNGAELEIDLAEATYEPASRTPNPGDLLIYVDDLGGEPWVLALSGQGDCLVSQGRAIDEGADLVFESALRLPKAGDYDPRFPGPVEEYGDQAHSSGDPDDQHSLRVRTKRVLQGLNLTGA
jgi:hypothetical protein